MVDKSLAAKRHSDKASLRQDFARNFDRAIVEAEALALAAGKSKAELLGEGLDCQAFRCGDVVLTVPKPTFQDTYDPRIWQRSLAKLSSLDYIPLIPPTRVLEVDQLIAVVTPFAPDNANAASPCWQPLTSQKTLCLQQLANAGLKIEDVLQIRTRNGVPFIIDFSDLRAC